MTEEQKPAEHDSFVAEKERRRNAKAARVAQGRYSISEACELIDPETNHDGAGVLMDAAMEGRLKLYAPGNNARFPRAEIQEHRTYLEAYWDDLNTLLAEHEGRIAFRYPAPPEAPEKAVLADDAETTEPAANAETPSDRKNRIRIYVDAAAAHGRTKESAYAELAESENCGIDNIKRIYYGKDSSR